MVYQYTCIMENDLENNEWKKEVPYMADLNRSNPFGLPEGYFETLSERIKAGVYLEELGAGNVDPAFKVPAGYFDNLSDRINGRVAVESLKAEIGEGGFAVPEQYFERLTEQIQSKTRTENKGGLVRLFQNNYFKYSAAACLVLMSGLLLYLKEPIAGTQKLGYMDAATEQMLFDIDEELIIEHIRHSEKEKAASKISDAELESYILTNFTQSDLTSE